MLCIPLSLPPPLRALSFSACSGRKIIEILLREVDVPTNATVPAVQATSAPSTIPSFQLAPLIVGSLLLPRFDGDRNPSSERQARQQPVVNDGAKRTTGRLAGDAGPLYEETKMAPSLCPVPGPAWPLACSVGVLDPVPVATGNGRSETRPQRRWRVWVRG